MKKTLAAILTAGAIAMGAGCTDKVPSPVGVPVEKGAEQVNTVVKKGVLTYSEHYDDWDKTCFGILDGNQVDVYCNRIFSEHGEDKLAFESESTLQRLNVEANSFRGKEVTIEVEEKGKYKRFFMIKFPDGTVYDTRSD